MVTDAYRRSLIALTGGDVDEYRAALEQLAAESELLAGQPELIVTPSDRRRRIAVEASPTQKR